ncbi:MAG: 30S ribosomal protein S12 methylthiotransferase RimO [Desulfobulbus sp.]|jgi:ribosomal protein S12 methylthiotransferase
MMKTVCIVSLGCPKNLVDSEIMIAALERAGYVSTMEPESASLVLVNTCGFIRPAVEEAIDTILEMARYKEEHPSQQLVVAGCMVQRYGAELVAELPEVDLFIGLDDVARIDTLLAEQAGGPRLPSRPGPASYLMDKSVPRRITTPWFRSYLKITEGCDNCCAYCMIPSIRGPLRSRPVPDLVAEARTLEAGGVRELSLIAQDLTAYGRDLAGQTNLVRLLEALLQQTSIPWFRLLYAYPSSLSDELLTLMAGQPRILPYLDIPFQHVTDAVLHRMHRHYRQETLERLVAQIRRFLPDCALRTTLLVGFPGETESDVDLLVDALNRWQLDHVGVFRYEDEEGAPAFLLPDKVSEERKQERYERVMAAQMAVSEQRLRRFVGRIEPVLIEGVSSESELLLEGRSRYQAPDVDGCVYITAGQVNAGDIVPVRITETHVYDLVGEVVEEEEGGQG